MTTVPHNPVWANAAQRREPDITEIGQGYACGPADAELDNELIAKLQEVDNKFAAQMKFAADSAGVSWSIDDNTALDTLLKTYQDIIKTDLTVKVPEEYDDIADALVALSNFRIAESASVIVLVAAGEYNHNQKVIPGHPDGLRILVQGPSLPGGMVTEENFNVSGSSEANIATDRITNESMLRGRFPAIIKTGATGCNVKTGNIRFENILFIGSGSNSGIETEGGKIEMSNCSVHNYQYNYLVDRGGIIQAPGCTASGAIESGFNVTNNGVIDNTNGVASGNGQVGYTASVGGNVVAPNATAKGNGGASSAGFFVSLSGTIQARAAISHTNEGSGFMVTNDGFIQARESNANGNKEWGYSVFNGGRINAASSTSLTNTLGDYQVQNFGGMTITGYGGSATTSPPVNTVGNGNGYIKN